MEIKKYFPKIQPELKLHADITGGTADVVSWDNQHASIADWKTGHVIKDMREQVLAYAYAGYRKFGMPSDGVIRGFVLWVRSQRVDSYEFSLDDIKYFKERHDNQVQMIGKEYNPGQHCSFCRNSLKCDVYNSWMNQAVEVLGSKDSIGDLGMAFEAWKCIERLGKRLEEIVKKDLSSGTISKVDLPSGDVARLVDHKRTYIDSKKAVLPILNELSVEELAKCVTFKKGSIPLDLQQKLYDAGAIKETVSKALKVTRKEQ